MSFPAELEERKIFRWAVAYLGGGWLALEVLDVLAGTFAWPGVVVGSLPAVVGAGFFIVLVAGDGRRGLPHRF